MKIYEIITEGEVINFRNSLKKKQHGDQATVAKQYAADSRAAREELHRRKSENLNIFGGPISFYELQEFIRGLDAPVEMEYDSRLYARWYTRLKKNHPEIAKKMFYLFATRTNVDAMLRLLDDMLIDVVVPLARKYQGNSKWSNDITTTYAWPIRSLKSYVLMLGVFVGSLVRDAGK
jgi:hypothetical protein